MNAHLKSLAITAKNASEKAYAPYSKFKVGAVVEDYEGNIYTGCNVENVAFPSGICAERTAIFKAVSEAGPNFRIKTLLIYTPTTSTTAPCGGCRQVMQEFATPDTRLISVCESEAILDKAFADLLPIPTEIEGLK